MKVYVLKIGYNPNSDEVEFVKEYIEGAKATLEIDGKEIELDDEIGDLIVSDEMGIA
jgi:cytochrome oxidase Cu insertion factor (SCO1/SenC/PrrC family)